VKTSNVKPGRTLRPSPEKCPTVDDVLAARLADLTRRVEALEARHAPALAAAAAEDVQRAPAPRAVLDADRLAAIDRDTARWRAELDHTRVRCVECDAVDPPGRAKERDLDGAWHEVHAQCPEREWCLPTLIRDVVRLPGAAEFRALLDAQEELVAEVRRLVAWSSALDAALDRVVYARGPKGRNRCPVCDCDVPLSAEYHTEWCPIGDAIRLRRADAAPSAESFMREFDALRWVARCAEHEHTERATWLASLPAGARGNPPPASLLAAEAATVAALAQVKGGGA